MYVLFLFTGSRETIRSSLWKTIKPSAHCCSTFINVCCALPPICRLCWAHEHAMTHNYRHFWSERGDNCNFPFCQIKANLPDVLRRLQKMETFCILHETPVSTAVLTYLDLDWITAGLLCSLCSQVLCLVH